MFGTPTDAKSTVLTSNNNVDALSSGWQWKNNSVTYSFTDSSSDYENNYESWNSQGSSSLTGFRALNTFQKSAMRGWFAQYANVCNLNLVELTGAQDRDATIRIASSSKPSTAYAYFPGDYVEAGDVFIGTQNDYTTPKIGSYAYYTFGHELGHALGLKHGHQAFYSNNSTMNADRDSMEFSIMTYRSYIGAPTNAVYNLDGSFAQSLMMYDISAIQYMYGADFSSNSGNTIYSFSTVTGEMVINGVGQGAASTNTIFRTIWDGNGNDTYDFSNYGTNLSIDLTPGGWSDLDVGGNFQRANLGYDENYTARYARGHVFNALQYNGDVRSLIENANGGSGNDRIVGNNANNTLRGNSGNDYLDGGIGNDYLDGGTGTDAMVGGTGNDTYIVDNIGDSVTETSTLSTEIDIVYAAGDYTLAMNVENLTLTGSAIRGTGNSLNNNLIGNSANNTLNGGLGADTMIGGTGNDTYIIDNIGDTVIETSTLSTEIDTVIAAIDYTLVMNVENLTLTGTAVRGNGNGFNNTLVGNNANNILDGGIGNDRLDGGIGNDYLDGGIGIDTMIGGAGGDTYIVDNIGDIVTETSTLYNEIDTVSSSVSYSLANNVEFLFLTGTAAINATGNTLNNYLIGNSAYNILSGGAGTDTLSGGAGNDILIGGSGSDWFLFNKKSDGIDTIMDFVSGTDTIGVVASGFGNSIQRTENRLNASQFLTVTSGSAATTSNQRFIYNSTTGGLFFDADGSGAGAAMQFATLNTRPTLSASDLFVV
jgi:serralysin